MDSCIETNLLIIHPGALGDVVLSLPAIRAIRQSHPASSVGLMATQEIAEFLMVCGEVDQSFSIDQLGLTGLLSSQAERISPSLQAFLKNTKFLFGWMDDCDGKTVEAFRGMGISHCVTGSPHSFGGSGKHQIECFYEALGLDNGLRDVNPVLELPLAIQKQRMDIVYSGSLKWRYPRILIHPGSGSSHKCSLPFVLSECIETLQQENMFPVLLQGPADRQQVRAVLDACRNPPPIISDISLRELAGVLSKVDLFIGHDSGATHLAAALSVPTIALFGPTDPQRWAPRGPHIQVLTGAPCHCNGWDQVRVCLDKPCLNIQGHLLHDAVRAKINKQAKLKSPKEDKDLPCSV